MKKYRLVFAVVAVVIVMVLGVIQAAAETPFRHKSKENYKPQIPGVVWEKEFQGPGEGEISKAVLMPDGGVIASGFWKGDKSQAWLMRLNADGEKIWVRNFSYDEASGKQLRPIVNFEDMELAADGNIFLATDWGFGANKGEAIWFAKVNPDGDIIWENKYSNGNKLLCLDFIVDQNSNIYIACAEEFDNDNIHGFILKVSNSGNHFNYKYFSDMSTNYPTSIALYDDEHFIIHYLEMDDSQKKLKMILAKSALDLTINWKRDYQLNKQVVPNSMLGYPSGKFFVGGHVIVTITESEKNGLLAYWLDFNKKKARLNKIFSDISPILKFRCEEAAYGPGSSALVAGTLLIDEGKPVERFVSHITLDKIEIVALAKYVVFKSVLYNGKGMYLCGSKGPGVNQKHTNAWLAKTDRIEPLTGRTDLSAGGINSTSQWLQEWYP